MIFTGNKTPSRRRMCLPQWADHNLPRRSFPLWSIQNLYHSPTKWKDHHPGDKKVCCMGQSWSVCQYTCRHSNIPVKQEKTYRSKYNMITLGLSSHPGNSICSTPILIPNASASVLRVMTFWVGEVATQTVCAEEIARTIDANLMVDRKVTLTIQKKALERRLG